jgi:hypothetical protein
MYWIFRQIFSKETKLIIAINSKFFRKYKFWAKETFASKGFIVQNQGKL